MVHRSQDLYFLYKNISEVGRQPHQPPRLKNIIVVLVAYTFSHLQSLRRYSGNKRLTYSSCLLLGRLFPISIKNEMDIFSKFLNSIIYYIKLQV